MRTIQGVYFGLWFQRVLGLISLGRGTSPSHGRQEAEREREKKERKKAVRDQGMISMTYFFQLGLNFFLLPILTITSYSESMR